MSLWRGVANILVKTMVEMSKSNSNNNQRNYNHVKNESVNYCFNCYTNIPANSEYCPYCGSINIKTTKPAQKQRKYPLKVKKISNEGLDYCNNCYTYIPKGREYCPHCGSISIQRK